MRRTFAPPTPCAWLASAFVMFTALACADQPDTPRDAFTLRFAATANGQPVSCGDVITGLGPDGEHSVMPADIRLFVSNVEFWDASGERVDVELDQNEFQYRGEAGAVALIDLTGNAGGACAGAAISFAEGTARTNAVITGRTHLDRVARVSFDVGVPQALMKEVIAAGTAEAAPSPLNEMYWSWASGYRHIVFNFGVDDGAGEVGEGYVHVGSRDCGVEGSLALEDREACGYINTPAVELDGFNLDADTVMIELPALLGGLDFLAPIYDLDTFEVIGEGPGVECHSSPMQADCATLFSHLGLDPSSGAASAAANAVITVGG